MKKLLVISSVLAIFACASASAKTSGNQVEVNLLRVTAKHQYVNNSATNPKFEDTNIGYGVGYKYAFNFDKFFVAPGVFLERFRTKAKDQTSDPVRTNNRYGIKLDVGYDITNQFAAYLTGGLSRIEYKIDWRSLNRSNSGSDVAGFYGAGFAFYPSEQSAVTLEYNAQSNTLRSPVVNGIVTKAKTDLGIIKLGLAYRF